MIFVDLPRVVDSLLLGWNFTALIVFPHALRFIIYFSFIYLLTFKILFVEILQYLFN